MAEEKTHKRIPVNSMLLGIALAAVVFLFLLGVGAFLTVRDVLPVGAIDKWLYGSVFVAVLLGGHLAVRRTEGGTLLPSLTVAILFFLLLWAMGLLTSSTANFGNGGVWLLVSAAAGGICSGVLGRGRTGKKRRHRSEHSVRHRK
jgi:putative membrane protein (TIGR04086 family)